MAEEHIFDRITKARMAEEAAQKQVGEIIGLFHNAASRLAGNWQNVSFVWRDEKGTLFGPPPGERDKNTIVIKDVPNLESICSVVAEWRKAFNLVCNLESKLTPEQRQVLRLPPLPPH